MSQLWKDESAFVVSTELVVVSAILVLGMMVGLVSLRDQVIQELGDVGAAVAVLQQGYSWAGITGHTSEVAGSGFTDTNDFCDEDPDPGPPALFTEPLCIVTDAAAEPEIP